jgi:hypothetical protein
VESNRYLLPSKVRCVCRAFKICVRTQRKVLGVLTLARQPLLPKYKEELSLVRDFWIDLTVKRLRVIETAPSGDAPADPA